MLEADRPPTNPPSRPRWFVRQDVDGLLGLALDNLIQILLIVGLCRGLLDYPSTLVYGRILPAVALSLIVGNVYYSWLAYRLGVREGRDDRTALPYGINTVSLFAHVFLVMLPVKLIALDRGATMDEAITLSWQAGLVACLGSGIIELIGAAGGPAPCFGTEHPQCAGTFDGISAAVDWRFAPKWDLYSGIMFTQVNGGLAFGFLQRNNIAPTAGLRFRF